MMQRYYTTLLSLLASACLALLASACSSTDDAEMKAMITATLEVEQAQAEKAEQSPGKPSAPINIRYTIGKKAMVGEELEISIQFIPRIDVNLLSIGYTTSDGLILELSEPLFRFENVKAGAITQQLVGVTPEGEGLFYLNIFTTLETAGGKQARTLAIPIAVGVVDYQKSLPAAATLQSGPEGDAVISLPAEESTEPAQ